MLRRCRPVGRFFYWVLVVTIVVWSVGDSASEGALAARARRAEPSPRAAGAAPTPQSGPTLTSVLDTVYMANGIPGAGTLVITWPAFVAASGSAVAAGTLDVTLGAGGALNVALASNAGTKPGADKKDAAMSFLQNALAMTDAVAAREIVNPAQFRDGISKIIDGTVECLNASTWCKQPPAAPPQPTVSAS